MDKIKVAKAEDHPLLSNAVKVMLEQNGNFEVLIKASDGQELLDKLKLVKSIDLILMDMNMPRMDGIEATRIVKQRWSSIKIVALSLIDNQEVIDKFYSHGGDLYLFIDTRREEIISELLRIMNR